MAKKRRVVWTETAAKQRNSILRYWVKNNKSNVYSVKLLELSNEKAELISKNPKLYRKSEYPDTRVASMGHYSIYYKVDNNAVIVTAFWDNRQDPKETTSSIAIIVKSQSFSVLNPAAAGQAMNVNYR